MKCLERNKSSFFYSLYAGQELLKDEYGNETTESKVIYTEPVKLRANISSAQGVSQVEQFGTSLQYDKVIIIDDPSCPIDEHSVLFVDAEPTQDIDGNWLFDYIVKKIAVSLNSVSIAISKVAVS